MIPKFSNPHLLRQATQSVSRADLDAEHDIHEADSVNDNGNDVAVLENILKRSLGDFDFQASAGGGNEQDVSAGPEKRKRKRRKVTVEHDEAEEGVV